MTDLYENISKEIQKNMETLYPILLPLAGSFLLSAVLLKIFIPVLRKVKLGQKILEIGPSWHKCKEGTPVLGGLFFVLSTLVAFLAWALLGGEGVDPAWGGIAILALCSCLTGFIDDYVKLFKKRNKGLTAKQKMALQILTAAAFLAYRALVLDAGTALKLYGLFGMESLELSWFYYPLMAVVIVYVINCANLTDGIDGLAGSVSLIQCVFFICAGSLLWENVGLTALSAALAGGLLGFLVFNFHPAKIFMGDTGSLFLGGFTVALAFTADAELLLIPLCLIWIIEGVSVMLQVFFFKLTGKRIFKMAPIHHHFEMCKWSEVRVVFTFSFVTAVSCGLTFWLLA